MISLVWPRGVLERLSRSIFLIAVLAGVGVIWIAPRPPLVDLPQHAAQVVMLRDLLLHQSPLAAELRVNFFTPYLLGYALALPLSFFMPVIVALKLVMTGAFLCFVWVAVLLRKELESASELDPFFAIGFFGFSYGVGLLTFIVASPLALAFILLAIKYARLRGIHRGIQIAALGTILLACHALAFLFAVAVGGLVYLSKSRDIRGFIRGIWPFLAIGLALVAYVLTEHEVGSTELAAPESALIWRGIGYRLNTLATGPFSSERSISAALLFLTLQLIPLGLGLKLNLARREAIVVGVATIAVCCLMPSNMWATNLVFERLTLFLLPSIAWMYARPASGVATPVKMATATALGLCTFAVMAMHLAQAAAFSRESQDFERILAQMQPGQRVLSLVFSSYSPAAHQVIAYTHYPMWYQVDRGGFVEFNFAWFHPEVVRYRSITPATISPDIANDPRKFDWERNRGWTYDYFLVRATGDFEVPAFKSASCAPREIAHDGAWILFESTCTGNALRSTR